MRVKAMLRPFIFRAYQSAQNLIIFSLIGLLTIYRYVISPWLGNHCRFYPTCSAYAQAAIREFGALKGIILTLWRLLRCHPGHPGGYDPIVHKKGPL